MSIPALPSRFDPKAIEARWQAEWEARGYFRAPDRPTRPSYTIPIPPPNVTGILTMGHMLGYSVMDILVRQHRMRGDATLWVPGLDHAGLSTQVEVRRRLAKQGIRLEEMPRAQILDRIEHWRQEHEPRIREQTRAGGFSVDWSRFC
ncbi:MAG: class I tRNA ligase family protein, partial [Thermoplasmata archaeon]